MEDRKEQGPQTASTDRAHRTRDRISFRRTFNGVVLYKRRVSTRCACTVASCDDQAKIVNRPSWDATKATESLIVGELRRRQMSSATEIRRINHHRDSPLNGLAHRDAVDLRPGLPPRDLRTEGEQFVAGSHHCRAIDGSQPGDRVDRSLQCLLPHAASLFINRVFSTKAFDRN
jgi:hypothetical protein